MTEPIYQHPADYDLEHEGDTRDIEFFVRLAQRLKPKRVLELACGTGRVTLPLAEAGAKHGFSVTGVELAEEMLHEAIRRRTEARPKVRKLLELLPGDIRDWKADRQFDLIISPCSSMCHLLSLEDQLAAWSTAWKNLSPGGRFVVDVSMPNLGTYADSFMTPPREIVEIDRDTTDPESGQRLIRSRTVRYIASEQRADVRYIYDRFEPGAAPLRYVSDYQSHVYFPRELQLLFLMTGFEIEETLGDYTGSAVQPGSRQLIVIGRKSSAKRR